MRKTKNKSKLDGKTVHTLILVCLGHLGFAFRSKDKIKIIMHNAQCDGTDLTKSQSTDVPYMRLGV